MKVWSLGCTLSYFSCRLPTLRSFRRSRLVFAESAHTPMLTSATILSNIFFWSALRKFNRLQLQCDHDYIRRNHIQFETKAKKYCNWMIFRIEDAKPILEILRWNDLRMKWSFKCLKCVGQCIWSWLDTSITLFLSETKWQYKRWILGLLHSKSLFT